MDGKMIWSTFYEVDQGKLSVLENAYDSCREKFNNTYHEDYNPLEGRKDNHSVCGNVHLNLTVEGISYDDPEVEYKLKFSEKLGCLVVLLMLFIIVIFGWHLMNTVVGPYLEAGLNKLVHAWLSSR